jgi:hypothetical protein
MRSFRRATIGLLACLAVGLSACGGQSKNAVGHPTTSSPTTSTTPPPGSSSSTTSTTSSTTTTPSTTSSSTTSSTTTTTTTPNASVSTYLSDISPVEGETAGTGNILINGKTYTHGVWLYNGESAQYDLKRQCDQLTYTAGITDDSPSASVMQFDVYGDGQSLKSFRFKFGRDARQTLNLTNVLRLKLQATTISQTNGSYAGWGDAAVSCSSSLVANP